LVLQHATRIVYSPRGFAADFLGRLGPAQEPNAPAPTRVIIMDALDRAVSYLLRLQRENPVGGVDIRSRAGVFSLPDHAAYSFSSCGLTIFS